MRTAGIDAKAALSSIKMLVEMEMNIKTAHEVTEIKYGGDNWDEWPHDVDKLAKEELRRQREINDQIGIEGQTWRLYDEKNHKWISGDIEKEIRQVVYEEFMKKWWSKKIGAEEISQQEWEEFKRLNRLTSRKEHFFAIKHRASILGTKLNLVRRKHGECSLCPCSNQEKNTDHIIKCQSAVQRGKIRDEMQDVEDEIQHMTSWEIREGLREVLLSLHDKENQQWKETGAMKYAMQLGSNTKKDKGHLHWEFGARNGKNYKTTIRKE
ncbi:predicted protein [Chaetoceros tenuissimus]|uniref:Uncharacterized protein n=1 Tax=Chaetoceros tenuissimus TaxID=426638 RepID=A0AAD3CSR0_9STRA|nr:predicted protein [Chaetoceros tenuissimus]